MRVLERLRPWAEGSAGRDVGWRRAREASVQAEVVVVGPPVIEVPLAALETDEPVLR